MSKLFIQFVIILICFFYTFSFARDNQKIVTLAPNLTEIVYALGLGNQLVGNTILCDYPEQAKKFTKLVILIIQV